MAGEEKIKYDQKGLEVLGKLTPEQYWKWRLTIEEMNHAKTKAGVLQLQCVVKKLEVEKTNLELASARLKFNNGGAELEEAKAEYDRFKESVEKEIGFSINNCVIDEFNYEIKSLPKD